MMNYRAWSYPLNFPCRAAILSTLFLAVGCGSGAPEIGEIEPVSSPTDRRVVERNYDGTVAIQGTSLPVTLRIYGPPSELIASLAIPALSVTANGGGELKDDRLRLALKYGSECPGEIRIDARSVGYGDRVDGRLVADDCTGQEEGTVVFRISG